MNAQRRLRVILFAAVGTLMTAIAVAAYLTHFSRDVEYKSVDARFSIRGTRTPVSTILGHPAGGDSFETIRREYDLTDEDITAFIRAVNESFAQPLDSFAFVVIDMISQFVGPGKAFQSRSINFPDGMVGQEGRAPARLAIPESGEDRPELAVVAPTPTAWHSHKNSHVSTWCNSTSPAPPLKLVAR